VNRRIAALVLLLSAGAVALTGCVGAKSQMSDLTSTPWAVEQILTSSGHGPVLPASTPVVYFRPDGTVVGNYTVNTFKGPYTLKNRTLTMGPLASTHWQGHDAEMKQDDEVRQALAAVTSYHIQGGTLQFSSGSGQLLMTLTVAQQPVLAGPVWVCTSYTSSGTAPVSVVGTSPISATFSPDGTIGGSTAINQYSGPYEVAGTNQMTIGPGITSTKMAGPKDLMAQEAAYLAAIQRTSAFKIEEYQLSLLDSSGASVAEFIPLSPKQ
jgi:heat shock protein HslJ